jgi:hypothetical protein
MAKKTTAAPLPASDAAKAEALARAIIAQADDALKPLAAAVATWPPAYRKIMWDAVEEVAGANALQAEYDGR